MAAHQKGEKKLQKRLWSLIGAVLLSVGLLASLAPAGATAASKPARFDWRVYLSQHGYLPSVAWIPC